MATDDGRSSSTIRFNPDGTFMVVDSREPAVYRVSEDGEEQERFGRAGRGPGEYTRPIDATTMGRSGTVVIADHDSQSLIFFADDGTQRSQVRLPGPIATIAANDHFVYVALVHIQATATPQAGLRPRLLRYDPRRTEWDTLVEVSPASAGQAPFYHYPVIRPLVRVGADTQVYLAFSEAYEIWRVLSAGEFETVVEGCIPPELRARYFRRPGPGQPHMAGSFIADFVVSEDGSIYVRPGPSDTESRKAVDIYTRDGTLRQRWMIDADVVPFPGASLRPDRPSIQISWVQGISETRMIELSPVNRR